MYMSIVLFQYNAGNHALADLNLELFAYKYDLINFTIAKLFFIFNHNSGIFKLSTDYYLKNGEILQIAWCNKLLNIFCVILLTKD